MGFEPVFLADRSYRPTRLSFELEEVDAVWPVSILRLIGSVAQHPEEFENAIHRSGPAQTIHGSLHSL